MYVLCCSIQDSSRQRRSVQFVAILSWKWWVSVQYNLSFEAWSTVLNECGLVPSLQLNRCDHRDLRITLECCIIHAFPFRTPYFVHFTLVFANWNCSAWKVTSYGLEDWCSVRWSKESIVGLRPARSMEDFSTCRYLPSRARVAQSV